MKLDWKAPVIPGKSMFNIDLGLNYDSVVKLLKGYEIAEGIIQIDHSLPMCLDFNLNKDAIRFKKVEIENYDWQRDVALLFFENGSLKSITTYLNQSYSYLGAICGHARLGDNILELEKKFDLEFDDVDEVIIAVNMGNDTGMLLHGASCDLSVDPNQKIHAISVYRALST